MRYRKEEEKKAGAPTRDENIAREAGHDDVGLALLHRGTHLRV